MNKCSKLKSSARPSKPRLTYEDILERRKADRKCARSAIHDARRRHNQWLAGGGIIIHSRYNPLLIPPLYCPFCGTPVVHAHAHHPFGYDWDNRFRVIFACLHCHNEIHVLEREMFDKEQPPLSGLRKFIFNKMDKRKIELAARVYNVGGDNNKEVGNDDK